MRPISQLRPPNFKQEEKEEKDEIEEREKKSEERERKGKVEATVVKTSVQVPKDHKTTTQGIEFHITLDEIKWKPHETSQQMEERENQRRLVLQELINIENHYIKNMTTLLTYFIHPVRSLLEEEEREKEKEKEREREKEGGVTNAKFSDLFTPIERIVKQHKMLLDRLEPLKSTNQVLEPILMDFPLYLCGYDGYIANYNSMIDCLQTYFIGKSAPYFPPYKAFSKAARNGESVIDYLILPVQHVPRYELLLQRLFEKTNPSHVDFLPTFRSIRAIRAIAEGINEMMKKSENGKKLLKIQKRFVGGKVPNLLSPSRRYIREGPIIKRPKQSRYYFLFNDLLLETERIEPENVKSVKKNDKFDIVYVTSYSLDSVKILGDVAPSSALNSFPGIRSHAAVREEEKPTMRLHVSGKHGTEILELQFSSPELKKGWQNDLREMMIESQHLNLEPVSLKKGGQEEEVWAKKKRRVTDLLKRRKGVKDEKEKEEEERHDSLQNDSDLLGTSFEPGASYIISVVNSKGKEIGFVQVLRDESFAVTMPSGTDSIPLSCFIFRKFVKSKVRVTGMRFEAFKSLKTNKFMARGTSGYLMSEGTPLRNDFFIDTSSPLWKMFRQSSVTDATPIYLTPTSGLKSGASRDPLLFYLREVSYYYCRTVRYQSFFRWVQTRDFLEEKERREKKREKLLMQRRARGEKGGGERGGKREGEGEVKEEREVGPSLLITAMHILFHHPLFPKASFKTITLVCQLWRKAVLSFSPFWYQKLFAEYQSLFYLDYEHYFNYSKINPTVTQSPTSAATPPLPPPFSRFFSLTWYQNAFLYFRLRALDDSLKSQKIPLPGPPPVWVLQGTKPGKIQIVIDGPNYGEQHVLLQKLGSLQKSPTPMEVVFMKEAIDVISQPSTPRGVEGGMRYPKLQGTQNVDLIIYLAPLFEPSTSTSNLSPSPPPPPLSTSQQEKEDHHSPRSSPPPSSSSSSSLSSLPPATSSLSSLSQSAPASSLFCTRMEDSCRKASYVILCITNANTSALQSYLSDVWSLDYSKKEREREGRERAGSVSSSARGAFLRTSKKPFWAKTPITPNFAVVNLLTKDFILFESLSPHVTSHFSLSASTPSPSSSSGSRPNLLLQTSQSTATIRRGRQTFVGHGQQPLSPTLNVPPLLSAQGSGSLSSLSSPSSSPTLSKFSVVAPPTPFLPANKSETVSQSLKSFFCADLLLWDREKAGETEKEREREREREKESVRNVMKGMAKAYLEAGYVVEQRRKKK
eukprot:CAMPEP_0201476712 /NCGR_PEP_ID=MMETSP0151_2-20130828/1855_1 /ASSEMBLY_ACC=CAM_ASM_000257 /TAXON_ID=200890 /ORGANISM="Paramoeba atlantica, Strain 621/1 / CCAP 1560/9" /LENGTH=1257 /DNA_ID=CAMNT_0047857173 /DNA_START=431 /DNA_END=4204 /DNA_ORIENTATION=-